MRFFHHHCPERLYLHCSQQRQQQAGGTGVKIQRHFHVSLLPVSRSFFPFSSDFRTKSQNMIEYWTFLSVGAMNGEAGDGESQTDKLLFYFSNIIKIPSLISPSMNDGSNNITKRLWLTSNQTRAQWTHTEHPKCCLIHWCVLLDCKFCSGTEPTHPPCFMSTRTGLKLRNLGRKRLVEKSGILIKCQRVESTEEEIRE